MLSAIFESLRLKRQWAKNLLVFGALLFIPGALLNGEAFLRSLAAFVVFSLAASAGYLINDIQDREYDQKHPRKKLRPIACGRLSPSSAIIAAVVLLVLVVAGGLWLDLTTFELPPPATHLHGWPFAFLLTIGLYFALTFFYSLGLKRVQLLDVVLLSIGFTLRAVAGAVAIMVVISPWLLLCTGLLALYLALGKRRQELVRLANGVDETCPGGNEDEWSGRPAIAGYTVELLDQLLIIAASVNVMSYSLYTFSAAGHPDNRLMLTIPFVIYGIFRYHFLIHTSDMVEAPEEILLSDKPLIACLLLWILTVAVLFMLPGFRAVV
jgi:4-hydroxybenzoate polyprenyltransferase